LSRRKFSESVAQPLGVPRTNALIALREGKSEQASQALRAAWRNDAIRDLAR
jgi:hypothetical protein